MISISSHSSWKIPLSEWKRNSLNEFESFSEYLRRKYSEGNPFPILIRGSDGSPEEIIIDPRDPYYPELILDL